MSKIDILNKLLGELRDKKKEASEAAQKSDIDWLEARYKNPRYAIPFTLVCEGVLGALCLSPGFSFPLLLILGGGSFIVCHTTVDGWKNLRKENDEARKEALKQEKNNFIIAKYEQICSDILGGVIHHGNRLLNGEISAKPNSKDLDAELNKLSLAYERLKMTIAADVLKRFKNKGPNTDSLLNDEGMMIADYFCQKNELSLAAFLDFLQEFAGDFDMTIEELKSELYKLEVAVLESKYLSEDARDSSGKEAPKLIQPASVSSKSVALVMEPTGPDHGTMVLHSGN